MTTETLKLSQTDVAAFLMARGHILLDVEFDGTRCSFLFNPSAAPDVDAYERNASVPAQQFAAAWSKLKGLIVRARSRSPRPLDTSTLRPSESLDDNAHRGR